MIPTSKLPRPPCSNPSRQAKRRSLPQTPSSLTPSTFLRSVIPQALPPPPRTQIEALLTALVRLRGFRVQQKRLVLRALQLYGQTNLDFGDTMIAAVEQHGSGALYSFDKDFDRLPNIQRVEP
jgi:predicted nucleic acid-binding protein